MFEDDLFDQWLEQQAREIFGRVSRGESVKPDEMIILVLKAQTNHFAHLDQDLRQEMIDLRRDMDLRFEESRKEFRTGIALLREDMDRRFDESRKEFQAEFKLLREDMDQRHEQVGRRFEQVDRRFEQVDKRFEQVDKRFEQVDRRFDELIRRMDRFMFWSLGVTISAAVFVVSYLK